MTQLYTYRGFSLRRAALGTKVMITSFIVTTAAALAVGVVNYRVRTGLTPSGAADWYRGGGELFSRTPLELLDATHPHLFGQAFFFFILCHLFALTPMRPKLKLSVYVAAFASVLVDAASPWLIRFVSPTFGWLQVAGTGVMVVAYVVLVAGPLKEMWFTPTDLPQPREVDL